MVRGAFLEERGEKIRNRLITKMIDLVRFMYRLNKNKNKEKKVKMEKSKLEITEVSV